MNIVSKLFRQNRRHVLHGVAGCIIKDVTWDEVWIDRPGGAKIYAHLHRPATPGRYPCVIFVPGGASAGTDYDRTTEVTAEDVAALGFTVLHYDPAGRGKTKGREDFWGTLHQEELAHIANYCADLAVVAPDDIGILSFSIGIAIAVGALARYAMPVRYLFDWEGPSNRFNITKQDTHKPLRDFPTTNHAFWSEREPSRFMGDVPCGYFRYQCETDHLQGASKGHALELLTLAARGKAAWTRCNDNPADTRYDGQREASYLWVPAGVNQKAQILTFLLEINRSKTASNRSTVDSADPALSPHNAGVNAGGGAPCAGPNP
jgi:alpha/beta superfamily hydrolase